MIFPLGGLALGAVFGALRAKSRGGNIKDIAQWAGVHAVIFSIVGVFVMIILQRLLG